MTQGVVDGVETVVKIDEIKALSGNTPTATGSMYAWNQQGGVVASSTRNITGIYDIAGGSSERSADYIANGHTSLLKYGGALTYTGDSLNVTSTKYTMVYPHDSSADNNTKQDTEENVNLSSDANYIKNTKIYGDAIREISMAGTGSTSWENGYSLYNGLYACFMLRTGSFADSLHAGRFYFARSGGDSNFTNSFRPVVVPMS